MSASKSKKTSTASQGGNATKTVQDNVDGVISIYYLGPEKDKSVSLYPNVEWYLEYKEKSKREKIGRHVDAEELGKSLF